MLHINHIDSQEAHYPLHFIYLHGKAETDNIPKREAGASAEDLCGSNEPLSNYWKKGDPSPFAIPCYVNGRMGVCVVNRDGGRVAYVDDIEAAKHVYTPSEWR